MVPSVIDRVRVGGHLIRLSINTYGTRSFWSCLSWWHEEIHYTIPQIEGEKILARELEKTFTGETQIKWVETTKIATQPFISFGKSGPSMSVSESNGLSFSPHGETVGAWTLDGFSFKTRNTPNLVRRFVVKLLIGAEWSPDKKRGGERKITPAEYGRWPDFVSEATQGHTN